MACHRAFTTPPTTRKRKAAEAAISDSDNSSATKGPDPRSRIATGLSSSISREPPLRRDSRLTTVDLNVPVRQKALDLATPAATTESMDSDDDFMSDATSQDDFLDTQGSDDESLGEGEVLLACLVAGRLADWLAW